MRVKEESENAGLKLNILKSKIMASSPIPSWQIDEGKMETMTEFIFLGSTITADGDSSHEIKRIIKWFAIPFSSGSRFVRTLHHDPSFLVGPTWHGS